MQWWAEPLSHDLDAHVAVLQLPFVVLLQQHRADQAQDGLLGGKDADHVGAPLDLLVEPLQRIDRVQLGAVLGWKCHVSQHLVLAVIHQGSDLWPARAELVSQVPPGKRLAAALLALHGPARVIVLLAAIAWFLAATIAAAVPSTRGSLVARPG